MKLMKDRVECVERSFLNANATDEGNKKNVINYS